MSYAEPTSQRELTDGRVQARRRMISGTPGHDEYVAKLVTGDWDHNPITAIREAAAKNVAAANRVARHTSLRQAANETGEAFVRRITVAMLGEMGG